MKTALIVEDQPESLRSLKQLLAKHCPDISLAGEAGNLKKARELIDLHQPDLVFLDVQLPDGCGFQLLKELGKISFKVIFTTAHDKYALQAIKFSALDYLLKPIDRAELLDAMDKYRNSFQKNSEELPIQTLLDNLQVNYANKKIAISTFYKIHVIKVSDIIHVESQANYSNFHLTDGTEVLSTKTLKEQDELLSPFNFIRINRPHLVNFNHIVEFDKADGGYAVMANGDKLPVSHYKKKLLLDRLNNL